MMNEEWMASGRKGEPASNQIVIFTTERDLQKARTRPARECAGRVLKSSGSGEEALGALEEGLLER